MDTRNLDLPVPYHGTFDVLDSSKLKRFMGCPRGFFYNYVLGWRHEEPSVHLEFGSAWHDAMEVLLHWRNEHGNYGTEGVNAAFEAFMHHWENEYEAKRKGGMFGEPDHRTKNPGSALKALMNYITLHDRMDNIHTLATEIAGTVPISPDRVIHFKLDSRIQQINSEGEVLGEFSMEHKTTGANSAAWRDSWELDFQINCYNHVMYCLAGDASLGVVVNGMVMKKDPEPLRIPVRRTKKEITHWLYEANQLVNLLEWNFEQLAQCSPNDDVMRAFPRNTESCRTWGCKFHNMCSHHPNPLKQAEMGPPPGMIIEFWDPRDREKDAKNVVHITSTEVGL